MKCIERGIIRPKKLLLIAPAIAMEIQNSTFNLSGVSVWDGLGIGWLVNTAVNSLLAYPGLDFEVGEDGERKAWRKDLFCLNKQSHSPPKPSHSESVENFLEGVESASESDSESQPKVETQGSDSGPQPGQGEPKSKTVTDSEAHQSKSLEQKPDQPETPQFTQVTVVHGTADNLVPVGRVREFVGFYQRLSNSNSSPDRPQSQRVDEQFTYIEVDDGDHLLASLKDETPTYPRGRYCEIVEKLLQSSSD